MTAALVLALAVAVLVGDPPARAARRLAGGPPARRPRPPGWSPVPVLALVAVWAWFGVSALLLALSAGVVAGTVVWLAVSHRRRRRAVSAAEECARAARILASLLRAGQIPTAALREAAADCPVLEPAAAAAAIGADVPRTLEAAASRPGQDGMRSVAAAWRVSERSGAPVAECLARVAENLRRQRQLQAVVEAELAAARASGRIMAALPFLAAGLGFAAGTNPLAFLLGGVPGRILLLAGVTLTASGVLWIDRLAQSRVVS